MKNLTKNKLLHSMMAVALSAGVGFSSNSYAVHIASDGVGQVLLAPLYSTMDNRVTKFAIYNTRDSDAVKVKVVIRSRDHSIELRDFICYMTPADVCRFELIQEDGIPYLTSTDDSVRSTTGKFASEDPLKIALELSDMKQADPNDTGLIGHVEIIGVYGYQAGSPAGNGSVAREMSKYNLASVFDTDRALLPANVQLGISSNNPELVRISGDVTIEKTDGKQIAYQIPALAGRFGDHAFNANGNSLVYRDPLTGFYQNFDGRVIANANFDANVRDKTPIGTGFGASGSDNLYELEYALASTRMNGTYETDGVHNQNTELFVTFPTKYRHRGVKVCDNDSVPANVVHYTHPFDKPQGTISFSMYTYDNHERRTQEYFSPSPSAKLYSEVNEYYPDGGWKYVSGYYDMLFLAQNCSGGLSADSVTTTYNGIPALGMTFKYNNVNEFLINAGMDRTASRGAHSN